jgi:ADP-ribose pyrophosphatase
LKKGVYHNDRDEETIVEEWSIEELKKEIYAGNIIDGKTVAGILAYCDKYLK